MLEMLQNLEPDVIKGLGSQADENSRKKVYDYFEKMKSADEGVPLSATAIANGLYKDDNVNFFLWQILEHQIKNRYHQLSDALKTGIRESLLTWLTNFTTKATSTQSYVKNKAAQVFALLFIKEYLSNWTTFPQDILKTVSGPDVITTSSGKSSGIDMFLRILHNIDIEVVDRTFEKSEQIQAHCQLIKDTMRDRCVAELVESWYYILMDTSSNDENIKMCLQIVGLYIEWIDVSLIVNDKFMGLIFTFFKPHHNQVVREAACQCVEGIVAKGMPASDKYSLVTSLWPALESCQVFQYANVSDCERIDLVIGISKLVSAMFTSLVNSYYKSEKGSEVELLIADWIRSKMGILLNFFINDDDDVSYQCVEAVGKYLELEKKLNKQGKGKDMSELYKQLFIAVVSKMKYDPEFDFENKGEDEAEFDEFLKSLKIIYENFSMLAPDFVMTSLYELLVNTLKQWRNLPFNEVEVAIRMLYWIGESLPNNFSLLFSSDNLTGKTMSEMMRQLVLSEVSSHPHQSVRHQYFETVVRYDRYFPSCGDNQLIVATMQAFLDERALRSSSSSLRSRCSYLFSKFVKTLGKLLNPFAEEILEQVNRLLVLAPENSTSRLLSPQDQMYMYELCGHVIVNNSQSQSSIQHMTTLLRPLVQDFNHVMSRMSEHAKNEAMLPSSGEENEEKSPSELCAETLNYAMGYASRTSKAFTSKSTMKLCGCGQVYAEALKVFMSVLDVQYHTDKLHLGFRQYMHRMVICLDDEVLQFIPLIVNQLVNNQQANVLLEFIPFICQIISKFKKQVGQFIHQIFMIVVRSVFQVINNVGSHDNHEDPQVSSARRYYFNFLHSLVTSGLAGVIIQQNKENFEQILATIIGGATEVTEASIRKMAFNIMLKIVDTWELDEELLLFICEDKFIPCCFTAPLNSNFDLNDAQTVLALYESCNLMKAILKKLGGKLDGLLANCLLKLNMPKQHIQDYCMALKQADNKSFRKYTKEFFNNFKNT